MSNFPWFLAIVLFCAIALGCTERKKVVATEEPEVEWVLSQYNGHNDAEVNARRIREGW